MNLNTMSSSAVCKEIGQRLKRARLNANRTQKEVADHAGLSEYLREFCKSCG